MSGLTIEGNFKMEGNKITGINYPVLASPNQLLESKFETRLPVTAEL